MALIAIFIVGTAVVWLAGVKIADATDVLSKRLNWGDAVGGIVVLAVVTNLPELAIIMSGAVRGDLSLAVGNILGGIAAQTVVLAILDGSLRRDEPPLTSRVTSLRPLLEALLVVIVLALVLAGTQLPSSMIVLRMSPVSVLIVATWLVGIRLIGRRGSALAWERSAFTDQRPSGPPSHGVLHAQRLEARMSAQSTAIVAAIFTIAALATLAAGVAIEMASDAIAQEIGMSGAVFGATVLALATSLPELSTGSTSVLVGKDELAIGDIFGGNAFLPVLFLPAGIVAGSAVPPGASASDLFLTAGGIVLTALYAAGTLFQSRRRILGMGVDSFLVLVVYIMMVGSLVVL